MKSSPPRRVEAVHTEAYPSAEFTIVGSFVMLNLIVAVILENFTALGQVVGGVLGRGQGYLGKDGGEFLKELSAELNELLRFLPKKKAPAAESDPYGSYGYFTLYSCRKPPCSPPHRSKIFGWKASMSSWQCRMPSGLAGAANFRRHIRRIESYSAPKCCGLISRPFAPQRR